MPSSSIRILSFIYLITIAAALHREGTAAEPTDGRLPPMAFVSRNPLRHLGDVPGFGPQYRTAVVGGRLMLRTGSGFLRTLVDSSRLIDVADPCVSWDGKRILFSGIQHADSSWRIFEIGVDGKRFHQKTFSDRVLPLEQFGAAKSLFLKYDDFDPCYMADGRIVFASTRYPSMAMTAQVRTSNIYIMEANGGNLHRITSERNGGEEPTIDPVSGKIVYSRWWANIDMPSNTTRNNLTREPHLALSADIGNIWHAIIIKPDGTELRLYAGYCRTREGMQSYKQALMRDGRLLSVYSPNTSLVPGSRGTGIRWFRKGADVLHDVAGVKSDNTSRVRQEMTLPFALDPAELNADRLLLSYSRDGEDYGIFSCMMDGSDLQPIVDLPGTLELEPHVVVARQRPPILAEAFVSPVFDVPPTEDPETYARNDFFRFDCMNVFTNGKVDEPMPDAPRIGRDLTIQFFMSVQRQSANAPDPSILLKTAPVFSMGGVHEHDVPAEVPLFEQLIDREGRVVQTTDGHFAHGAGLNFERMGAGTKCVGCHMGHSMLEVPKNGAVSEWFNAAPSASVTASSEYQDGNGMLYAGRKVVDRQARGGGDSVVWIANESNGAFIDLRWPVPIEVRTFVLYSILPTRGRNIAVDGCRIILYYEGKEMGTIPSRGFVSPNGKSVSCRPTRIDAARIVITRSSGTIRKHAVTGLAEVETIARLFPGSGSHSR